MLNHQLLVHGVFALTCVVACGSPVDACTRIMPIAVDGMLDGADAIVRGSADGYAVPAVGERFTQGFQLGTIRFIVREALKGKWRPVSSSCLAY